MSVRVRVDATIRIALASLSSAELAALEDAGTVEVRERHRRRGVFRWITTPRRLFCVDSGDLVLPRGMIRRVREVLGNRCEWVDMTSRAPFAFESRVPYRSQQSAIAEAVAKYGQGLALAPTGLGKTGAACATVAAVGQTALILTPTTALAAQWKPQVMRFLGVDAAVCTGGEWSDAPVVVATPITAARHADRVRGFGLLIVDEVQGFSTEQRCELIGQIPARYRLGLTATLPKDHRGEVIRATFGPVLCRFGVREGIASGALVPPVYRQVRTAFRARYTGANDWRSLLDSLVTDERRNAQIVDLVARECAGVCTLVLSTRLAHLDVLRDAFAARGMRVAILSGATHADERETVLTKARAGELDVLLGSTVADEGIDIPGLGALVLAFPSKAEGRLMQRIGRVVRAAPGKPTPQIFDLVDDVGPLRRQAELRRSAYAAAYSRQAVAA